MEDLMTSWTPTSLYGARIVVLEVDGHTVVIPGKE